MTLSRTPLLNVAAVFLAGLLATGALRPALAHAATAPTGQARGALEVERRKLIVDLDRANAEIEQLKKKDRGVRDDYRLRARMADAESMARRLTEIDASLGVTNVPTVPPGPRTLTSAPEQSPGDGPAELEAKADILTDQSRRLLMQADTLNHRLTSIKDRLELRRRAGQLENDPFAPLEGSRRRVISGVSATGGPTPRGDSASGGTASVPTTGNGAPPQAPGGANILNPPVSGAPNPVGMPGSGPAGPPSAPGDSAIASPAGKTAGFAGITAPAPVPAGSGARSGASGPALSSIGDGGGGGGNTALSTQLRDVLDANALATIRKLELAGTPGANLEAMERAAAALRERAQRLQAQSEALRQRARPTR